MLDFSQTPSSFRVGYQDPPDDLVEYEVVIPTKGISFTINELHLVRGEGEKAQQDEFWYNHLNGNGVLEIIAQVQTVYALICEYKDKVSGDFQKAEALAMKKYKYKGGSSGANKNTQELFRVLMESNRPSNEDYWNLQEEKIRVDRLVGRVSKTLELMTKVYEVARTRNANERAFR